MQRIKFQSSPSLLKSWGRLFNRIYIEDRYSHSIVPGGLELISNTTLLTPVTSLEAIIFGSYAKGNPKEESDIDVALVLPSFTGDRFEDRRKIVPLRRKIDGRIEPIPFKPDDFVSGGNLVDEIKRTGKRIAV